MNANTAVVFAATMAAKAAATDDGRAIRADPMHKFSIRTDAWARVQAQADMFSGWYQRNFRCSPAAFDAIVIRSSSLLEGVLFLPRGVLGGIDVNGAQTTTSANFYGEGYLIPILANQRRGFFATVAEILKR